MLISTFTRLHYSNQKLYLVTLGKGIVHPKVKNYVMIYTHCFNPV